MLDEYVRGQLRTALFELPLSQKGQIAIMSDSAAGDRHTARPVRTIDTGTGCVEVDAEPVRYREGKKYKQNKPLILDQCFKSSIWRQSVNRLNDDHLAWANYCYGESLKFEHQVLICSEIWRRFEQLEAAENPKKMSAKTRQRVQRLTWLAVQVAASQLQQLPKIYKNTELAAFLGVAPDNWQTNYLSRWTRLISVCHTYDSEVIRHVERQHKAERHRRGSCGMPV